MIEKIKEKYKKAWKKWEEWLHANLQDSITYQKDRSFFSFNSKFNSILFKTLPFQMLYGLFLGFFDEQGIVVQIDYYVDEDIKAWTYALHSDSQLSMFESEDMKTRTEAQQAAIEEAFEILEEIDGK